MSQYPSVVAVFPEDGMTNVPVDCEIRAKFSVDMDGGSIRASTFYVARVHENLTVPSASPVYFGKSKTAVIKPAGVLEPNTQYCVTLVGGTPSPAYPGGRPSDVVCDVLGRSLQTTIAWTFITGSSEAEVAPTLTYPIDGLICSFTPRFVWTGDAGVCDVQVAYTSDFMQLVIEDQFESGSVLSVSLADGTYWWRVRRAGQKTWSQGAQFSVVSGAHVIDDFQPRLIDRPSGFGFPLETNAIRVEFPGRLENIEDVALVGQALLPGIEAHGVVPVNCIEVEVFEQPTLRTVVIVRFGD